MPFIPHTETDRAEMLETLGLDSLDELFRDIPGELRTGPLAMPGGLSEMQVSRLLAERAGQNRSLICFAGAGAYQHHIPAAVWEIVARGEYYSAYTPYQAEASQGTLQILFEYQTMMARLTGHEVSNASLYDGAAALAEAVLMAARLNRDPKRRRVLVPASVHPAYRKVMATIVDRPGIELTEIPYDPRMGRVLPAALGEIPAGEVLALVVPQPNFFGVLEEVDELTDWAASAGAYTVAVVNPTALGLLKPPGEWGEGGADIACGDGQPLGIPLSGGGPYFGFLCCRKIHVHQMPGRVVGRTLDRAGNTGFTLTLQAREQHIRRGKATSNVCTNQGLMVSAAAVYLALLGPAGLRRVAECCHGAASKLRRRLAGIPGVEPIFPGSFFHEVAVRLPIRVAPVLSRLADEGFLGGHDMTRQYPELGDALLTCATELRTGEDIETFSQTLERIIRRG